MSPTVTKDVLDRATTDEAFLARFRTDPEAALDEYDLEPEARDALLTRDEGKLREILGEMVAENPTIIVVVP